MAIAMRCSQCSLNWPNKRPAYSTCPSCGMTTSVMTNCEPMDESEAASIAAHAKFEAYLERETPAEAAARAERDETELPVREPSPERAARPLVSDEEWAAVVQTFNSSPDLT